MGHLDGSIERGYAGRSIFFENGHVVPDLPGDEIRIDVQPDGKDHADIDYVEITAARD